MHVSAQQVESLARDAATADRARKLAAPIHWVAPGASARAIWAEHRGSSTYQVRVDLRDLASRCSCPVPRQPCKHALGLLFFAAQRPAAFAAAAEPEWVAEWLDRRDAAAERKSRAKEAKAEEVVDPRVQERRAEARESRAAAREGQIADGLDLLDTWLADLVRVGLAAVESQTPGIFEDSARRLVDAKAGGLAGWVRRLAAVPLATPEWQPRLLGQLGRLALFTHAFRRLGELEPALQIDLRQLVGIALGQDEVLAHGDRLRDRWQILGQIVGEDEASKLLTRRTWLWGQSSRRAALVLHFTPAKGGRFAEHLPPGAAIDAELAFYPGQSRQRALIVAREGAPEPVEALAAGTIAELLTEVSAAVARQPWLERFPARLRVAPAWTADGALAVVDAEGAHVPVRGGDPYLLLAVSGGMPVDLVGEWDGDALMPLGALVDRRFIVLHAPHARAEESA